MTADDGDEDDDDGNGLEANRMILMQVSPGSRVYIGRHEEGKSVVWFELLRDEKVPVCLRGKKNCLP